MRVARWLLGISVSLAVAGCGSPPVSTAVPTDVATPGSTPLSAPSAIKNPFADVIHLRALLGLPNDEAHVRALAEDADAVERGKSAWGFPLTAEELAVIEARARNMDQVGEVVRSYAVDHPDTWAGMFVDTPAGSVIAQFTRDLPAHRQALAALLHPDAKLEIRPAQWTLAELKALNQSVRDDEAWFESIDTELIANGVDVSGNKVQVTIRTNREDDVAPEVLTHFNAAERMAVLFGGGIWTGGSGDLVVVVRDPNGNPLPNLECAIEADDPDAFRGDPTLFETDDRGRCRYRNIPADVMTVSIRDIYELGDWTGSGRVRVRENDTVTLEITAERSRS